MNRAQRRAAQYKRPHHDRNAAVEPAYVLSPALWSRSFDAEEAAKLGNEARMAWHHLTSGSGTERHFDTLAQHINCAAVIAADIDELLLDIIDRAQAGLEMMQARYRRLGKFGPDAIALQNVPEALDAYDEILRHATPRQMTDALQASMRAVRMRLVRG